jgi:O-antigen ligase
MTGSLLSGSSTAAREDSGPAVRIAAGVRWPLWAMAFSMPLEYPDRFAYEVTTMTGAVFVLSTLLQPRACFGQVPWAIVAFAGYLYALLVSLVTQGVAYPGGLYLDEVGRFTQLLVLWLLVFFACSNVFRDERACRGALWALVLGCLVRASLPVLGLAQPSRIAFVGGERITVWGQNANQSALVLASGLLALVGLVYIQRRAMWGLRTLTWLALGLITYSIVQTGSRGGLVTVAVGLLGFAAAGRTLRVRVKHAVVTLLALGVLVFFASRSDLVRSRVELAREGNLANRERIYPELVGMFREKPLLGWGPITNKYELGVRLNDPTQGRADAHNILLEILTSAGMLGVIPFLTGIYLCVRSAWSARSGPQGTVPLAMAAAVLVGNMTQNRLLGPLLWMVLAYALASGRMPWTVPRVPPLVEHRRQFSLFQPFRTREHRYGLGERPHHAR